MDLDLVPDLQSQSGTTPSRSSAIVPGGTDLLLDTQNRADYGRP